MKEQEKIVKDVISKLDNLPLQDKTELEKIKKELKNLI